MGNSENKQSQTLKDWQKIDTDNGIEIFQNSKTQQLAEKRLVTLDSNIDTKKQLQLYQMRQNNNDALVKTFGTDQLTKIADSFVSCAGGNKIFVFTEKMPHRLSELPQLTFPESLLFLRESLRAYERLFKEYGPVEVTKELIGLNYLGEVKSWLNSNWALNHRNHEYGNLRSKKLSELTREQYLAYREQYLDEPEMIKSIISVIEKKCEEGVFPQAFKEEVISQSGSFKKLLLYLKDFVEYNQIYVPERISYDELVNTSYHVRLEHQLNFANGRREGHEITGNRQGQVIGQNLGGNIVLTQEPQHQPNRVIGYQTGPPVPGYSQSSIPQPLKESPLSVDMGQVTFSQSTRSYNQQDRPGTQVNYQWSNQGESSFTPSFQKVQQSPPINTFSTNQGYSIQPPVVGTTYQGGNYSTFGGLNTNVGNNDFSYKYTGNSFGTSIEPAKPNITGGYGLSNGNYAYSSSYSTTTPASNLSIGGINSVQNVQNTASFGYKGFEDSSNKWNFTGPSTTSYTTETYNFANSKPVESSFATTTSERPAAFSFDGRQDQNSRFGTGYTGTGYSNTLTKYETQSTNPSGGFSAQGKYSEAFNTLLNPSHRGQTFEQITSTQSQSPHGTTTIVTTTHQKRESSSNFLLNSDISGSNVSGRNAVSQQQSHTPKNALDSFNNVVERVSNEVSESVLRE